MQNNIYPAKLTKYIFYTAERNKKREKNIQNILQK